MTKSKKRQKALQQEAAQKAQRATAQEPTIDNNTTCESSDKVLSTPELLELIFLNLDMAHLLTAVQRVCKHWHGVIAQSAPLQQHLFFKPIHARTRRAASDASEPPFSDSDPVRTFNPLLYKNFPGFYPYDPDVSLSEHQRSTKEHQRFREPPHQMRDGVVSSDFKVLPIYWPIPSDSAETMALPIADVRNGGKRHYAFTRKGASWRRMLVSQPPPVRVARIGDFEDMEIEHDRGDSLGSDSWEVIEVKSRIPERLMREVPRRMLELQGGLRMGDLLDELWSIQFGVEYPFYETIAWCAWKVPTMLRITEWQWLNYDTQGYFKMPATGLTRWADEADLVIGGWVPRSDAWSFPREFCSDCVKMKTRGKRCKPHLTRQQRYRCQEYRANGPLSLTPRV